MGQVGDNVSLGRVPYWRFHRIYLASLSHSNYYTHLLYVTGSKAAEAGVKSESLGGGVCSEMSASQTNQDRMPVDPWGPGAGRRGRASHFQGDGIPTTV